MSFASKITLFLEALSVLLLMVTWFWEAEKYFASEDDIVFGCTFPISPFNGLG
jgi:hypothetical protein